MCGIVGIFSKTPAVSERLGEHLGAMLTEMGERGPDSAGVAVYRDPVPSGHSKLCVFSAEPDYDWIALHAELRGAVGARREPEARASHAVFVVEADAADARTSGSWGEPTAPQSSACSEIQS